MSAQTERRPTRGRPSIVDAMAISEAALEVWQSRGYAETGWKEISEASGVSVRTLMRHFSSRAEIAWLGVIPAADRLRDAAQDVPADVPLHRALRIMVSASVTRDEKVDALGPAWIRLVASEPELRALTPTAHNPWIRAIADVVSQRRPDLAPVIAHAIAVAYQSATFAALSDWAGQPTTGEAADAVEAALEGFEQV